MEPKDIVIDEEKIDEAFDVIINYLYYLYEEQGEMLDAPCRSPNYMYMDMKRHKSELRNIQREIARRKLLKKLREE